MPKINVYLPDDLATAVREAGIPVSPVCQKALAEAVRLVGRAGRQSSTSATRTSTRRSSPSSAPGSAAA